MLGRIAVLASIAAELRIGGVLPPIIYGVAYSATLFQIGGSGTLVYADPGSLVLPTGVVATDNGDGSITFAGISTASGLYPITIDGLDGDRNPVTADYTLTVQVLPISISGDADDMRIGESDTFSGYGVSGGSGTGYIWAIASGALPPGWGPINAATGHIPRTPTTVGNYSWGVKVTDSLGNVSAVYADNATIRYPVIMLTGAFASLGIIGVPYSSDLPITGGDGTYSNPRFTSGAVSGMALTIVTVSGVKKLRLSGTPTTHETDSITVAVDAHEFDGTVVTATHSQSVTEDPALTMSGTFTTPAVVGVAYQSDLLLGGGDGTFALGNGGTGLAPGSSALPGGLALSVVTVSSLKYLRLSGNPTTQTAYTPTVSIDAGDGQNVTAGQSVTVWNALAVSGAFTEGGHVLPLTSTVAITGGQTPYTVSVLSGTQPPKSSGGSVSFAISGASAASTDNVDAAANGSYTWTLRITSNDGQHYDLACTTAIVAAAQSIKTKITNFWGFDSAVTDQARGGQTFAWSSGSPSYVSGVGGRNALGPTPNSAVTVKTTGAYGNNAYHGSQKWAFGAFIKPSALSTMHIVLGGNAGGNFENVWINSNLGAGTNKWGGTVRNSALTQFSAVGGMTAVVGTRVHVVLVCDGTNLNLYVNGVLDGTVTGPTTALNYANVNGFNLGQSFSSIGSKADVQDMFWMHEAPTVAEIQWMYNGGSGRTYSTVSGTAYAETSHDTVLAALTPTGFWKCNQTSGSSATDSGSLGAGTMTNGAAFSNAVALPNNFGSDYCAFFDGSNDYLDLPAVNYTSGSLSYTQFGWFYPISQTDAFARYMSLGTSTTAGNDGRIIISNGIIALVAQYLDASGAALGSIGSSATIATNAWMEVASVYDSSSKTFLLIRDGITIAGGVSASNPTAANLTVHRVGALSATLRRLSMRAARLAHFKGVPISLPNLAKLSDLGRL